LSFTEDRERLATQGLADECGHHATILQAHPRAVRIEDADDVGIYFVKAMVGHRDGLGETFGFVINTSRPMGLTLPQ